MQKIARSPYDALFPKSTLAKPFSATSSSASASSSDVEKIYRTLRKLHSSSPQTLAAALNSLSVPDLHHPILISRVLSRCGPSINLALPFLSFASRHPDFIPSPSLHKSLLSLLSRSRNFTSSWSLIHHLHLHHPSLLSPDLFLTLLRRFAKARLISQAINVLDQFPHFFASSPDHHHHSFFSSLLDALAKNGAAKEAAKLLDEMQHRFPPTLKNFTSLLYGWCREGKMQEAVHVLARMKQSGFTPDVVVYNTLVSGFCAARRIEDARSLLDDMRTKGCPPNVITYTALIQGMCAASRVDDALQMFVEMRSQGCFPDSITYTTLVGGFARCGRMDRAFEVVDAMARSGCRSSPAAYFPIFAALEKREDLEGCLELKERMVRERCLPDLGVYNSIIRLACRLGELDKATELWNEMEGGGLSPGLDSFVIIVHGFLGQEGSLLQACTYFREMVGRGLLSVPQYGIMKDLLNSLLRDEKLELAKEMWSLIVNRGGQLNVCAWTIWIQALFARRHVKEACLYCLDMMDAGQMPQPDTFARLMKGLKKLYNRAIAAEITEKVRGMAAERNVSFKMYKRRGVIDLEKKMKKKKKKMMGARKGKSRREGSSQRGSLKSRRDNRTSLSDEDEDED